MNTIKIIERNNYCIVQLDRGKVNAINHRMVEEVRKTIKELEADDNIKGVIITGKPHFFSAGLDVIELYGYDEDKMRDFFISFGSMHLELAQFTKPLIAAITGHSPAGGCVIAIACDYRIMADGDQYTIGLNEVAVNVQITQNLINSYGFWIGPGRAHQLVMEGKLLKANEAMDYGLINEVYSLEEVLPKAEAKMQHYLQANEMILRNTKARLRKNWLDNLNFDVEKDLKEVTEVWWDPEVRARMKAFVEHLQNK